MLKDTTLLYFYEVARCGSIRQAAERLHVSPSAISRMITKAEHQFQAELFERRSKGMNLTAAGRILADQLRGVMTQLHDARAQIDELRGLRRGEVRLYCIEGVVMNVVPGAVASFNARHPNVSFRINVGSTDRIVETLQSDESDLGITFNMRKLAGIEVLFTFSQPLHLVVAPDHPLSRKGRVSLAEIVGYPVVMPDQTFGLRAIFDRALEACGIDCRLLITTNSVVLTRASARSGAAVTLSPPFAAEPEVSSGQVVIVPVKEQRMLIGTTSICKRSGRNLSAAATEFLGDLQGQFEALSQRDKDVALRRRRTSLHGRKRPSGRSQ